MADRTLSDPSITNLSSLQPGDELYVIRASLPYRVKLEDFRETGTFTPLIKGSVEAGSNTYTKQIGFYSRIGDIVFFNTQIELSAKDVLLSGNLIIDLNDIPYTTKNITGNYTAVDFSWITNLTMTSGYFISGYTQRAAKEVLLQESNGTNRNSLSAASLTDTTSLMCSGFYLTT